MVWAIADGYIPQGSTGPEPEMVSHETACFLNASARDADVQITISSAIVRRSVPTGSASRRTAPGTCASTTWQIRRQSLATPTTPA